MKLYDREIFILNAVWMHTGEKIYIYVNSCFYRGTIFCISRKRWWLANFIVLNASELPNFFDTLKYKTKIQHKNLSYIWMGSCFVLHYQNRRLSYTTGLSSCMVKTLTCYELNYAIPFTFHLFSFVQLAKRH